MKLKLLLEYWIKIFPSVHQMKIFLLMSDDLCVLAIESAENVGFCEGKICIIYNFLIHGLFTICRLFYYHIPSYI